MSSITYQPHIDGLRAVAVMLVILHHLGDWGGLTGGFVGVDVFFVISGFLITSIVKSELETETFTFGGFYKRRVVRLAPAYFTVLLATTFGALIWMLPGELMAYARSMIASSLFLANFHMWKEVGGYFGVSAETVPLLHLWTLAVEEQFYLFWPMVLLLFHRVFRRNWIVWVMGAVVVFGIEVSHWGVSRYPAAAYYLLPTRFFELATGALLAYLPIVTKARAWSPTASLAGLAMILYAALSYGKETLFPGYAALVPVLGTAMALRWAGRTWVGAALSNPIATLIGRISYPAYLWHWPIIAFLNLNEVAITVPIGVVVVALTLLLAWLTYRCVELPARRFRFSPVRRVVVSGGGGIVIISVLLGVCLIALQGFPGRFSESLNQKSYALLAHPNKERGRCNEAPPRAPQSPEQCILGRRDGKVDFLLVGDSHANHFTGFLDVLGKEADLRGYDITRSNTPFLPGVDLVIPGEPGYSRNFRPRNEYVSDLLVQTQYEVIVLAGNYTTFFNRNILHTASVSGPEAFKLGMRNAVTQAYLSAQRVVLIAPVPALDEPGLYDCSLRNERFGRQLDCTLPVDKFLESSRGLHAFFADLKSEFPELIWVEPWALMCDLKKCVTEMGGLPLYKDGGHLNNIGSRVLAEAWIEAFGNPLKPSHLDAEVPRKNALGN